MSILENNDAIKKMADQIKIDPPTHAWDRLEKKINTRKKHQKSKLISGVKTWLSIAASICIIATCFTFIYLESNSPATFKRSEVVYLQDLETTNDYFYSIENARENNKIKGNNSAISSDIDLKSLKGTSLLPTIFRDYPI